MLRPGQHYVAIDPSQEMVDIAHWRFLEWEMYRNYDLEYMKAENQHDLAKSLNKGSSQAQSFTMGQASPMALPFDDESFDVVILNGTLASMKNKQ